MESIKDFASDNKKKDLILAVLRESFPMVPEEDYLVMVDLIFAKLATMTKYRDYIKKKDGGALKEVAENYNASVDAVLDSYIYFFLIVESVYLQKTLFQYLDKDREDK